MSSRSNKRRVANLFHERFHSAFIWRSAEDYEWLNVSPVGREFGSPDYDRLMQQDHDDFMSNLSSLVDECRDSCKDSEDPSYAELDDWVMTDCDPWVLRHVVPLLTGPSLSRDAARASLQDWFTARPRSVQAACDSDIDWRFLLELLGDRPSNLAAQRHDLASLLDTASYNNMRTAYFAKGHPEHHALNDARAYRLGWLAWMDARKSMPC